MFQAIQRLATSADALQPFVSGADVDNVLNNWKQWRSTLATAVQGYLAACDDLSAAYALSPRRSSVRQEIETVLLAIDSELESLASEEVALCKARTSLAAARNFSTRAPIHALPPEILANIFLAASHGSGSTRDSKCFPLAQSLAGTSSSWRQIAISTPSLWTQINIRTDQTNYNYATLLLNRSDSLPIGLYIFEPKIMDAYIHWSGKRIDVLSAFLIEASRRIHTLDIESLTHPADFSRFALKNYLNHGFTGIARTLRVRRPNGALVEWRELKLTSLEHTEGVLSTVEVLHLQNIAIPWSSEVYSNLVDLRLHFDRILSYSQISIRQLANVLKSSPRLATLKIVDLAIRRSDNDTGDRATVVHLTYLKVLYLHDLSHESCQLLLPLIPLGNCPNNLSIGLYIYKLFEIAHLVRDFLQNAYIKMLASPDLGWIATPQAISIFKAVRSLETLVLISFKATDANGRQLLLLAQERTHSNGEAYGAASPYSIPQLFMVSSYLSLENLKIILSMYNVQTVHLDECTVGNQQDPASPRDIAELGATLLESCPGLVCVVSDLDTTSQSPCRVMFDP